MDKTKDDVVDRGTSEPTDSEAADTDDFENIMSLSSLDKTKDDVSKQSLEQPEPEGKQNPSASSSNAEKLIIYQKTSYICEKCKHCYKNTSSLNKHVRNAKCQSPSEEFSFVRI